MMADRTGVFYVERLGAPLVGLIDGIQWKAPVALGMAWFTTAIMNLFEADGEMVLLVVLLVIADFLTGIIGSLRRGGSIRSIGFRQTGIKVLEYLVLLAGCTAVGNKFDMVAWLGPMSFFFVCLTELKSVVENVTGAESQARKVFKLLRREMEQRTDIILDADEGRVFEPEVRQPLPVSMDRTADPLLAADPIAVLVEDAPVVLPTTDDAPLR